MFVNILYEFIRTGQPVSHYFPISAWPCKWNFINLLFQHNTVWTKLFKLSKIINFEPDKTYIYYVTEKVILPIKYNSLMLLQIMVTWQWTEIDAVITELTHQLLYVHFIQKQCYPSLYASCLVYICWAL